MVFSMSFQAYFDVIEDKTGLTPCALVDPAKYRGCDDASVKAGAILGWLRNDYGLGWAVAMAQPWSTS